MYAYAIGIIPRYDPENTTEPAVAAIRHATRMLTDAFRQSGTPDGIGFRLEQLVTRDDAVWRYGNPMQFVPEEGAWSCIRKEIDDAFRSLACMEPDVEFNQFHERQASLIAKEYRDLVATPVSRAASWSRLRQRRVARLEMFLRSSLPPFTADRTLPVPQYPFLWLRQTWNEDIAEAHTIVKMTLWDQFGQMKVDHY